MAKQQIHSKVVMFTESGKVEEMECPNQDVCDWLDYLEHTDVQRFIALADDGLGVCYCYRWGDSWYTSSMLGDCNDYEIKAMRELMQAAEIRTKADLGDWVRDIRY